MMSTTEERLKILNMIAEGKLTAEEGAKLLDALRKAQPKQRRPGSLITEGPGPRFLRVRVTDRASGKVKVNVNLPLSLIDVGIRMGARFVPDMEEIDLEELILGIKEGSHGKIIDVEDEEDGEHVEIYLE
jgi:hypothetical protein